MTNTAYQTDLDQIITAAQEDLRAARKAMRRLAPTLPDTAAAQTALGLAYLALDQPRDAMRTFKHAIELDPQNPTPRYHLGALQGERGLLPQAEANLRLAVAAEPANAAYQAALGLTLYRANKTEEAIATLEKAIEAGSEDPEVFVSLGYLYYAVDRIQDSHQAFSRTLELAPDYSEVYNNRGYLNILLGDLEQAQTDLATCLEQDEDYLRARYNQALATWLQGQHEEAEALYEKARRRDRADAELQQHLDDFEQVQEFCKDETLSDLKIKLAVAQKARRR